MYCAKCGKPNDDDARFCRWCGSAIEGGFASPAQAEASAAPSKGLLNKKLAIAAAAVVLIAAVIALMATNARGTTSGDSQIDQNVAPSTNASANAPEGASNGTQESGYFLKAYVLYDEDGSLAQRSESQRDEQGAVTKTTLTSEDGSVSTIEYENDSEGCRTVARYSNGNVVTCENTLDADGRLTERKAYLSGKWGFTAKCFYSQDGTLAGSSNEYSDGSWTSTELNELGCITHGVTVSQDGSRKERWISWNVSPEGHIESCEKKTSMDNGSTVESRFTFETDNAGNIVRAFDSNGTVRAEFYYALIASPYPSITHERYEAGAIAGSL